MSSPLTPLSTPPASPSPIKTPAIPPSPASPSKRSASRTGIPAQTKRTKTRPTTPTPSQPGRGNLFCPIDNVLPTDGEDPDVNENVFRSSPVKGRTTRGSSVPRMPKTKATAVTKARLAGRGLPTENINAKATVNSSPRRPASPYKTNSSPIRRVPSLRAS